MSEREVVNVRCKVGRAHIADVLAANEVEVRARVVRDDIDWSEAEAIDDWRHVRSASLWEHAFVGGDEAIEAWCPKCRTGHTVAADLVASAWANRKRIQVVHL